MKNFAEIQDEIDQARLTLQDLEFGLQKTRRCLRRWQRISRRQQKQLKRTARDLDTLKAEIARLEAGGLASGPYRVEYAWIPPTVTALAGAGAQAPHLWRIVVGD